MLAKLSCDVAIFNHSSKQKKFNITQLNTSMCVLTLNLPSFGGGG
jgi:hypothetical protein